MPRDDLARHAAELLEPLGRVTLRRMFGGHGLYVDGLFVAIVAFERLYLKADAATRARFEAAGCAPFVYEARGRRVSLGYFEAPAEAMESPALMQPWGRLAMQAALSARAAAVKPRPGARRKPARTAR
jgi:DNA transformation protein